MTSAGPQPEKDHVNPPPESTNRANAGPLPVSVFESWFIDHEMGELKTLPEYISACPDLDPIVVAREFLAFHSTYVTTEDEGARYGRFECIEEVGRGNQAVVWKALDPHLDRIVALKILHRAGLDTSSAIKRLNRESRLLSQVNHPAISRILDAGERDGLPYIAMEFVQGTSLEKAIASSTDWNHILVGQAEGKNHDLGTLLSFFEQAARGLHAAHLQGIVHRDIKPANIMITPDRSPVILDFGLAQGESKDSVFVSQPGSHVGSPAYMAPEQLQSGRSVDVQADVWALGVTIYETFARRLPFLGHTIEHVTDAIKNREPYPLGTYCSNIPGDLETVVATALSKEVSTRYATVLELAEELERVRLIQPIVARPIGPLGRVRRWAQRNPLVALSIALVILSLSITAGVTSFMAATARDALTEYDRLADTRRLANAKHDANRLWPVSPGILAQLEDWQARYRPLFQRREKHLNALDDMRTLAAPLTMDERAEFLPAQSLEIRDLQRQLRALATVTNSPTAPTERSSKEAMQERITALKEEVANTELWRFPDSKQQFRHDTLNQLTNDLSSDATEKLEASVSQRILISRNLDRLTRSGSQAKKLWVGAAGRVLNNERYQLIPELRAHNERSKLFDRQGRLRLVPQYGLLPLGPDPTSGLEEFLHIESHVIDYEAMALDLPRRRKSGAHTGGFTVSKSTGMIFVLIPGGISSIGCQSESKDLPNYYTGALQDEQPVNQVVFDPYFLSKYEMTQGQWSRLAQRGVIDKEAPFAYGIGMFADRKDVLPSPVDATHPCEGLSWHWCMQVAQRLGLQLPTEAQWEFAARAGSETHIWAGTDSIESLARFANISGAECKEPSPSWPRTMKHHDRYVAHAPVGSFMPNAFGLYDMSGNVFEWCRDPYAKYWVMTAPGEGLRWSDSDLRILRGGSYQHPANQARVAFRGAHGASLTDDFPGFRPARAVE